MKTKSTGPRSPLDAVGRKAPPARLRVSACIAVVAFLLTAIAGPLSAATKDEQRDALRKMAQSTLDELYAQEPAARDELRRAAGYAVFSNFGMKILVAGTGKGKGIAVNNASGTETFMKMVELEAGLGLGIKKYRLIWVFGSQSAFNDFITNGRQLGGQAAFSARVSGKGGGVAGAASVDKDVWLYQLTDNGLAAEVTVKASKYYKDKDLN